MILGNGGSYPFTEEGMKALLKLVQGVTIVALDAHKKSDKPQASVFGFTLVDDQVFQVEASSGKVVYPIRTKGRRVQVPVIVNPMRFFKNVPMFPCWMMIHGGRAIGMMNATLRGGEDERASINVGLRETPMMFVARMVALPPGLPPGFPPPGFPPPGASSGSSPPISGSETLPSPKPFIFITD